MYKKKSPLLVTTLALVAIYLLVINLRYYMAYKQNALANAAPTGQTSTNTDKALPENVQATQALEQNEPNEQTEDACAPAQNEEVCQNAEAKNVATPATETAPLEAPQQAPARVEPARAIASRTLGVTNQTTEKKLGYKFMMITYSPDEFSVTANGVAIERDETKTIPLPDNKLEVIYYAKFKNGRESSQKYSYTVEPSTKAIALAFDWHADPRIVIEDEQVTYLGREVIK